MQVTRTHKIGIVIFVCVLLLCGVVTYALVGQRSPFSGLHNDLKNIDPPINLPYTDLEGNAVTLNTYKGKPLIINSWASWMPFSRDELTLLSELKNQQGDTLQIIAINRMEDREVIKSYINTFGIEQNIVFLVDQSDNFYKAIGGFAMPETIFYKKDGTITVHKRGVLTKEELEQNAEFILN